jgi:hypothetical protein
MFSDLRLPLLCRAMFKTRHVIPGSAPATLTPIDPAQASKPVLKLTEYNNEEIREQTIASVDDFPPAADDGKVRWIEMDGLGDADALRALGEKYDLHPLAIEGRVARRPTPEDRRLRKVPLHCRADDLPRRGRAALRGAGEHVPR